MGGSVRCPSVLSGTCCLKPTSGRLPQSGQTADGGIPGIVGIHNSLGLMARTVSDVEACLEALLRETSLPLVRGDPRFVPLPWRKEDESRKLRIGWQVQKNIVFTICFKKISIIMLRSMYSKNDSRMSW